LAIGSEPSGRHITSQCSGRVRVASVGSFGTMSPGASRDPPEIVIRYADKHDRLCLAAGYAGGRTMGARSDDTCVGRSGIRNHGGLLPADHRGGRVFDRGRDGGGSCMYAVPPVCCRRPGCRSDAAVRPYRLDGLNAGPRGIPFFGWLHAPECAERILRSAGRVGITKRCCARTHVAAVVYCNQTIPGASRCPPQIVIRSPTMSDPRRIQVPWYSQRWHLRYIFPAVLFWSLAGSALFGVRSAPVTGVAVSAVFAFFAVLFTRIVWQERFPLRSRRGHVGEVGEPAAAVDGPASRR
jgi:hypothetical protein